MTPVELFAGRILKEWYRWPIRAAQLAIECGLLWTYRQESPNGFELLSKLKIHDEVEEIKRLRERLNKLESKAKR